MKAGEIGIGENRYAYQPVQFELARGETKRVNFFRQDRPTSFRYLLMSLSEDGSLFYFDRDSRSTIRIQKKGQDTVVLVGFTESPEEKVKPNGKLVFDAFLKDVPDAGLFKLRTATFFNCSFDEVCGAVLGAVCNQGMHQVQLFKHLGILVTASSAYAYNHRRQCCMLIQPGDGGHTTITYKLIEHYFKEDKFQPVRDDDPALGPHFLDNSASEFLGKINGEINKKN